MPTKRSKPSRPRTILAFGALLLLLLDLQADPVTASDVIVLANRTGTQLGIKFQPTTGAAQQLNLTSGDVRPLFVDSGGSVEFTVQGGAKRYQLDPNSAYYFGRDTVNHVDMQKIGLGDEKLQLTGRRTPTIGAAAMATINVKILVDEEEPARQFIWEQRLRRRIEAASEIISRHCHVQLKVVEVGTWNSDNSITDFFESLTDFEKKAPPGQARVAIGFTSQFQMVRGRTHMAGTRGPLHSHILVREGSPQIDESERLEFLVHELGHFLGASHSPERDSVMRPVLGDNLAGRNGFQIRFDPVNTLVMAMIGEEMRTGRVSKFVDLSSDTKKQLHAIYTSLSQTMPEDASGGHFVRLAEAATNEPLIRGARRVALAIKQAAVFNRALPQAAQKVEGKQAQRTGDELCDYLVRQAALTADSLPDDIAPTALLLGLAVGMDDSDALLVNPEVRTLVQAVESPAERSVRVTALGEPTILKRRDLARRFFVSAYLSAALGEDAARDFALARELVFAKQSSFSFAFVAADRAGIRWGDDVNKGRFSLKTISTGFSGANAMPAIDGLPTELLPAQFTAQFGSFDDNRFRQQLRAIDQQIANLPLYRSK